MLFRSVGLVELALDGELADFVGCYLLHHWPFFELALHVSLLLFPRRQAISLQGLNLATEENHLYPLQHTPYLQREHAMMDRKVVEV